MSQVNTNSIYDASGGSTAKLYGVSMRDGGTGWVNRIINGDMRIDARNAGAIFNPPPNQGYSLDRWTTWLSQNTYSVQRNAGSVTPPAGFSNYLGVTTTSATSIGVGDYFGVGQKIEGFNLSDLAWGSASAQSATISFWVRSSLTGNFGAVIRRGDGGQYYAFTYAISAANTWEYKTVVVPGPTSGSWDSTNGTGLFLLFGLGAGTNQTASSNNTWINGGVLGASGATAVVATNGATFYITGVQLEKGSTATSFDYRPYGTELQLCQRYFEKSVNQGTSITKNAETSFFATVPTINVANSVTYATQRYAVTKRTAPTVLVYPYTTATNTTRISTDGGTDLAANSAFVNAVSDAFFSVANTSGGIITTGSQLILIGNWYASAEL